MIRVEHIVEPSVEQILFMIEGMRNPKNSWDRTDTICIATEGGNKALMGENDIKLMKTLKMAGTEHRKYMRQMPVAMRITAPLYWWKEFDTYKVGTTSNSCSTMHKIQAQKFELSNFSCEHISAEENVDSIALNAIITALNHYRDVFLTTKNKDAWYKMIQLLPTSYNQTRNVTMNYEVLNNMYRQRREHKLDEWRSFCEIIKDLEYGWLIV